MSERINWRDVDDLIAGGAPAVVPVSGIARAQFFVEPSQGRIGVRLPIRGDEANESRSPLRDLTLERIEVGGSSYLQLTTRVVELFPEFVTLANRLIERVTGGQEPHAAMHETLELWRSLTTPVQLMSEEEQTGLWGEMWVLRRLLEQCGTAAVRSWIGPLKEPHDFRLGTMEFEVKTTRRTERLHWIHGASQLTPSSKCSLHMVSIQVEPSGLGEGESLAALVRLVEQEVSADAKASQLFRKRLQAANYDFGDEMFYRKSVRLRSPVETVEVGAALPKIDAPMLKTALGSLACRLKDVTYLLDVSGLGNPDGSDKFALALKNGVLS